MKGSIVQREVEGIFGVVAVHTGIVTEDGTVIHFNDETEEIEEVSMCEFANGYEVEIRNSPEDYDHADRVVERAREIMADDDNGYNGQYNFLLNNCQDFTQDCFEN